MVLQRTKLGVIAFLVLQLATACVSASTSPPTPPPSPTPGPVDLVMAFQGAVNRGAIDEAVALFHNDPAGLIIPELDEQMVGSIRVQKVRDIIEYGVGLGMKLELTGCQLDGDVVNCKMTLNHNCINGIIPGGLPGTAKFKFLDGKINLLLREAPVGDAEKKWYDTFWNDILPWASKNRSAESIKLNSSPAAGATWHQHGELAGKLCADWAAASK
jgi:hypothetical protein